MFFNVSYDLKLNETYFYKNEFIAILVVVKTNLISILYLHLSLRTGAIITQSFIYISVICECYILT
jgi:hypothetical protein